MPRISMCSVSLWLTWFCKGRATRWLQIGGNQASSRCSTNPYPDAMKRSMPLILLLTILALPSQVPAQTWTGTLQRGGVVTLDPNTNRATLYTDKGSTPLWDGTYRLQNGKVIIVENGVVISGAGSHQTPITPAPEPEGELEAPASSACVELVIKVCGFNGECSDQPACSPARQLMQLERDEAWQTRSQGPNQTTAQCREALQNEAYFARCERKVLSDVPTACTRLVDRVCGEGDQCSDAPACAPARQLLAMETQERLASRDPDRPTYSSQQCQQALEKADFFKPCQAEASRQDRPTAAGAGSDSGTPGSGTPPFPPPMPAPVRR